MRRESIAELLMDRVGDDHPGLRAGDRVWTWCQVVEESAARGALAASLHSGGCPFHIGVLLDNVPEYVFWLGGAALRGATIAGINPTRRGADLEREVRHVDCALIVTDAKGLRLLDGLDVGVGRDRILLVDDADYPAAVAAHACAPHPAPGVGADDLLLLLFTSGSTGRSKAARCTQGRLAGLGHQNSAKYGVTRADVSYCCMPLFHGNALMALWAPSLVVGATIALTPKFSASGFLDDVRFHGATFFTYVGKAIAYVLATAERRGDADNPLTHGFGTEASPEDRAAFLRRFGARLHEGYGSSEIAGMVRHDPRAPATALGRPAHPGVAVVDPATLRGCPPASIDGHGRVRNAEEAVGAIVDTTGAARFEGYYKNAAADAERVRNGWFWTGDLGYTDAGGLLYFAGRDGDRIRVDGENVSAPHIERILRRHPGIRAAAVFGVPDPRTGDAVMAAVEVGCGTDFADLGLPAFLAAQRDLGTKSAPRYVRVSTALPATGSNKLRRSEMRLQAWCTADLVHHWTGRGGPAYTLMTEHDKARLHEEFRVNGRLQLSPYAASNASP